MLVVDANIEVPLSEFSFSFSRSAGPGGQHVNKVNTKVTLHWGVLDSPSIPGGVKDRFLARFHRRINKQDQLVLTSQRFRDRGRNVADCLHKLREMILEVRDPPRPRKATKPTRSSRERRLKSKRLNSQKKERRRLPRDKE
ncbi:MAG: aminoacyl-tRNA hydrolase [Planctomycetaceae bacterium]|nr:aminoacyl-tRNA hydrolase [Planctomycetaceae bacterium]MCP4811785.1 aminoacyl-tRNA hydrolase [Planctomycetaceae bacterium]